MGIYYPELAEKLDRPVFLGGPVQLISPRRRGAALLGFLSGIEHGETILDRWKSSYTDYIRTNEPACARIAAQNETLLHLMMEERLLSGSSTEELLNSAIAEERADLTAELLAYKKRVYPPRPGDIFSLEDEPPAASRAENAARRRDALLRRIGISGLRLAAAGRQYDLAFIDAAKSHYKTYFEESLTMMKKGGLILCDNLSLGTSLANPGEGDRRHRTSAKRMERFLKELAQDARVETTFYETGDGFSVSRIL